MSVQSLKAVTSAALGERNWHIYGNGCQTNVVQVPPISVPPAVYKLLSILSQEAKVHPFAKI